MFDKSLNTTYIRPNNFTSYNFIYKKYATYSIKFNFIN